MGVTMYWLVVAAVLLLGALMPQQGRKRKYYILTMAILHAFICGFRYQFMHGDLMKYNTMFHEIRQFDYFSDYAFNDWVNTGFLWLQKFIADATGGDFQVLLIVISIVVEAAVAVLVLKYSPRPWLSYLVWNCMGFYIFGFSGIKQALAMALVMLASTGILDKKPMKFLILSLIAGFIHFPAFAFLPAYLIANLRVKLSTIIGYVVAIIIIYLFRDPIVLFVTDIYYEEGSIVLGNADTLGGRFFMVVVILVMGIALKGFGDRKFEKLFNLLLVAAVFQMFSGFNHVFTRFADYYFQFSILYLPIMVSSETTDIQLCSTNTGAPLCFNDRSLSVISGCMAAFLLWYYQYTCLGQTISYEVDNILNFRFMWDVK